MEHGLQNHGLPDWSRKLMARYLWMKEIYGLRMESFVTANIIVRTDYLKNNPDVIKKLLADHVRDAMDKRT